MLKGVNKNIVEINDTGNMYFERAVLFIRPEMNDVPRYHILKEASGYLSAGLPEDMEPVRKHRKSSVLSVLLFSAGILTVITVIVLIMISR